MVLLKFLLLPLFGLLNLKQGFNNRTGHESVGQLEIDGQIENLNKCIEHYLHCFIVDNRKFEVDLLPWA